MNLRAGFFGAPESYPFKGGLGSNPQHLTLALQEEKRYPWARDVRLGFE